MYSSGVDDETIKSTLRDIGLKEHEIRQYLKEVKGGNEEEEKETGKSEDAQGEEPEEEERGKDSLEGGEEPEEGEVETGEEPTGDEKNDDGFGEDEDLFSEEDESGMGEGGEDEHEKIASKTAKKIKNHLDEHFAERELNESASLNALEEQRENVGAIHKKLDELHEKFSSQPVIPVETISKINSIEKKILGLEKEIIDLRAGQNALHSLMKKILEANQQILNRMKK